VCVWWMTDVGQVDLDPGRIGVYLLRGLLIVQYHALLFSPLIK